MWVTFINTSSIFSYLIGSKCRQNAFHQSFIGKQLLIRLLYRRLIINRLINSIVYTNTYHKTLKKAIVIDLWYIIHCIMHVQNVYVYTRVTWYHVHNTMTIKETSYLTRVLIEIRNISLVLKNLFHRSVFCVISLCVNVTK